MNTSVGGEVFHATAQANLDADSRSQIWHYRTGDLVSKDHLGVDPSSCAGGDGTPRMVEPCDSQSGQSVF